MTEWIRLQLSLNAPGLWLLFSLIAGAFIVAIDRHLPPWGRRADYVRWAKLARWVLIPYWGLLIGSLSPQLIGLTNINWPATFGLGLSVTFFVLILLIFVRSTVDMTDDGHPLSPRQPSGVPPASYTIAPVSTTTLPAPKSASPSDTVARWGTAIQLIIMAGAEEFHWAFLRGGLWDILLTLPAAPVAPGHSAVWLAALFTIPDLLARRDRFPDRLLHVAILLTTTILFFYTRNFWLCWAVHAAMWVMLSTQMTVALASQKRKPAPIITTKSTAETIKSTRRSPIT